MAEAAAAEPGFADRRRDRLHAGLTRRNRLVGVLRWAIPITGTLVLLVVVGGIVLDNLRHQFGFSNLRIDRNNLVIDTPELHSTTPDGTAFSLSARAAKAAMGSTDVVELTDVAFSSTPAAGRALKAEAASAELQTSSQLLTVAGTTRFSSSDGMVGTVEGLFADLIRLKAEAAGAVTVTVGDRATLEARGMSFDGKAKIWVFHQVRITLFGMPGETK